LLGCMQSDMLLLICKLWLLLLTCSVVRKCESNIAEVSAWLY